MSDTTENNLPMCDDLSKLEHDFDATLEELRVDFAAPVSEAALARVQTAVRHELNELWLGDRPDVAPPDELIEELHDAVHRELNRSLPVRVRRRQPVSPVILRRACAVVWGGLATAAVVALWVGLPREIQPSAATPGMTIARVDPPPPVAPVAEVDDTAIDQFLAAAEEVLDSDEFNSQLADDLAELEASLDEGLFLTGESGWDDDDDELLDAADLL